MLKEETYMELQFDDETGTWIDGSKFPTFELQFSDQKEMESFKSFLQSEEFTKAYKEFKKSNGKVKKNW